MQKFIFSKEAIIAFIQKNLTALLVVSLIILVGGGFAIFKYATTERDTSPLEEVDLLFDPEGVYALLLPRTDGNALVLDLNRTSAYDSINYELAYRADSDQIMNVDEGDGGVSGIDRGVVGDIIVDKKQPEYSQEILFGTCSKNVCKYDKGVENGTLTMHLAKGRERYRVVTPWKIQNLDVEAGKITSVDEHFRYQVATDSAKSAEDNRAELVRVGYSIVNEVTGVPKLPRGKEVFEKVYALNVPEAKTLPKGDVVIETAENPPSDAKIAVYIESENAWRELDTKIDGSTLTAQSPQGGIFAILVNEK